MLDSALRDFLHSKATELFLLTIVRINMTHQTPEEGETCLGTCAASEESETCLGLCAGPPFAVPGYAADTPRRGFWSSKRWADLVKHVELGLLFMGTLLVAWQLRQANQHKEMDNFVAIIERTSEHNWQIINNEKALPLIEKSEDLFVRDKGKDDREAYWAARALHLSHLNLLWQVWELEGRPPQLSEHNAGWTRFAQKIVGQMAKAEAPPKGSASDWAAYDLWNGLHSYEVHPPEFVAWLEATIADER